MAIGIATASLAHGGTAPELAALFAEWRALERPPLREGAPDYGAQRLAEAAAGLRSLRQRLDAMDRHGWTVPQQVDWHLLRAEMNGFAFNLQVLRPWERDPAFYVSLYTEQADVPAREGPTHHATIELWTYDFPLSPQGAGRLTAELRTIPPLLAQARQNLRGEARDLWVAGAATIRAQSGTLAALRERSAGAGGAALDAALMAAERATRDFADWLDAEAPSRQGPSGIGRARYDWYQRHVRYVPLGWEDELRLLERERARAWSALALEEARNRELPPLVAADTPEEMARRADLGAKRLMGFLAAKRMMPIHPNMAPALREHLGGFVPAAERNFFEIGRHLDPVPLYCHFYHWFDLARVRDDPHPDPLRRGPLLYNIFDSYSEGIATAVEEMFMHAGLLDDSPRSREIVWIMLAQRAARGIGSLHAHANTMDMAQAGSVHVQWTPRGWMSVEPTLLAFEQHLYLRQPGYGTSYLTGKYLVERLLAARMRQAERTGAAFSMEDFFREFQAAGAIPVALLHWELTGDGEEIRAMAVDEPIPDAD